MFLRNGRRNDGHRHAAPPAHNARCRLRAIARALRQWWAEERHYRPERRYMRG